VREIVRERDNERERERETQHSLHVQYIFPVCLTVFAEALIVASKEIGLAVNADRTKYMVMSREQTAGRSHNMRIDNRSFERVEELKCLGTTLTNHEWLTIHRYEWLTI
jgi:hypothetical protein